MDVAGLFALLWRDYAAINPQADRIHSLLEARGESILNDHVAFRTLRLPGMTMEDLARPFETWGYQISGHYTFPDKHLTAIHLEAPRPHLPKVFISQLHVEALSGGNASTLLGLANQIPREILLRPDACACGRPWIPSRWDYEALLRESEYAAWFAAFGFRANHFTVAAQNLKTFGSLESLNEFLENAGFTLNPEGGIIKGTLSDGLRQSSTRAEPSRVVFAEGAAKIPACYYEFAWRTIRKDGKLFQGFVTANANNIFSSTNARMR